MSVYELPVEEFNNDIQEKIKLLQDQLKPTINPIIQKILPFPYDVNKNILDKLHIQKLIHIYKTNLKKYMYKFIKNNLPYYYEPYTPPRTKKIYDSMLDYSIRTRSNRYSGESFYYHNFPDFRKILNYWGNKSTPFFDYCGLDWSISNFKKLDYDMRSTIYELNDIIYKFDDCMDNMTDNLNLDKYDITNRTNQEITIGNETGNNKTFKIFKGGRRINPKPYKEMLEYIKEYVLRKKTEVEDIIEKIEI